MSLLTRVSENITKSTEVSEKFEEVKVGDLVKILYKTVGDSNKTRKILGVCIGKYKKQRASYLVIELELGGIKLSYKFPIYSNKIINVEVVQKQKFKISKAKG